LGLGEKDPQAQGGRNAGHQKTRKFKTRGCQRKTKKGRPWCNPGGGSWGDRGTESKTREEKPTKLWNGRPIEEEKPKVCFYGGGENVTISAKHRKGGRKEKNVVVTNNKRELKRPGPWNQPSSGVTPKDRGGPKQGGNKGWSKEKKSTGRGEKRMETQVPRGQ